MNTIKQYKFNRKMAKQRAKRGFSDDMCWGMCDWFLETFPKMIINLRDMKHGYPELNFEEVDNFSTKWITSVSKEINKLNKKYGYDNLDIKDTFSRWQLILTRIAYCLIQANEDTTDIKNEYREDYVNQIFGNIYQTKQKQELEKKYFEREKEIIEYRDEMKNEAFDLLKKYFWNLWD